MSEAKLYYQPNGGVSAIPDIKHIFNLKVFGCEKVDDYDQEKTFLKLKNASKILQREILDFNPEVVIIETLNSEMLSAIIGVRNQYKGSIILFWADLLNQNSFVLIRRIAKYIDLVLILDKRSEMVLRNAGLPVEYTLFPTSSSIYHRDLTYPKVYDTVFAGNMPYKTQWYYQNSSLELRLDLIRSFSSRPRFGLFGGAEWKRYGIDVSGWVNEYDLANIYNQAKIVLASDQILDAEGFTSNRTTKVLMSGAFLMIKRFSGIESIFTNHKHLVWFDTVSEALQLADYYLTNDCERERIANNGYTWAQENADISSYFVKWSDTKQYREYHIGPSDHVMNSLWQKWYYLRRGVIRGGGNLKLMSPDWFWFTQ